MNILGLGGSGHSFSACILKNGEIKYAIEEERLNKIKHSLLPDNSIHIARSRASTYCLEAAKIPIDQLDLVIGNDLMNELYYTKFRDKIILINHHLAHASSCYFTSNYAESAILVIDGRGSNVGFSRKSQDLESIETVSYYYGNGNKIKELGKISGQMINDFFPANSVGEFYDSITREIGFGFLGDGKTMGLAAYGKDTYVKEFERFYYFNINTGNFKRTYNQNKKMKAFIKKILQEVTDESEIFQRKADLAYAVQFHLEKIVIGFANFIYRKTKSKNLCLSGGVFLNSVANYKILKETPFEHIYVFPAAGDSGLSIGSALYGYHVLNNRPKKEFYHFSPFLGKEYQEEEILDILRMYDNKLTYEKPLNLYDEVANFISLNKIIGWFQGKSEFGPRALGNRSILVNPQQGEMKGILNHRIKKRENFRPFAPTIIEEYQADFFELDIASHYMLMISPVKNEKIIKIPAVTHVDGSARIHTVNKSTNYKLFKLISAFKNKTNIPLLLNTSFNTNNMPIVESPIDAVKCFLESKMDYLVIEDFLITKK
ncbi:carbamoyltransferase C-terminal domain-containing protein [Bacillus sp. 166amftsu]|uniref:carbamoyltransferase family protein n=1 Tax=Bacillus sp. 166amftsu TaxID=1761753 RepID=UPI00089C472A|nr:carbamoyltransferase C-terminal domain-containing protein [Bacillus sp. 166amftsu]SDZ40430.1 carbamoyltransferase [Bacillus sp. 166amftsu]